MRSHFCTDQTGHYLAIMERHLFSEQFNQHLLLRVSRHTVKISLKKTEAFQIYFENGCCKGKGNNMLAMSTAKRTSSNRLTFL